MWMIFVAPVLAGPDVFGFGNGAAGALVVSDTQAPNAYQPVTSTRPAGASEVVVADGTPFPPGTLVLLHQTTGGTATPTFIQPPPPVDYLQMQVGQYEYARVLTQTAGTLVVNRPLLHGYRPGAQVVAVPEYTALTVEATGVIEAPPWDGSIGGIVALMVDGDLQLDGAIDASARGFRGADPDASAVYQGVCTELSDDPNEAGFKGEGIAGVGGVGRGTLTTGAGGANCGNAGGGGGGNAGYGGRGGNVADFGVLAERGGFGGGWAQPDYTSHALFGGGGGGADADDHPNASRGAAGGGLVLVSARDITGSGTIRAAGGAGINNIDDGASGGGAGGTIVVRVLDGLACSVVDAGGGRGGNVSDGQVSPGVAHGPGGGGGGGHAVVEALSPTCPRVVTGGVNGSFANTDPWGAQPGAIGVASVEAPSLVDADGDGVVRGSGGGPDCNDGDAAVFPGADEVCDGRDNDCNGAFDDGLPTSTFYADDDGDGFGDPDAPVEACGEVPGIVADATDCDDTSDTIHPGAEEVVLDGIDQDCDGEDRTSFEDTDPPDTDTDTDTDTDEGRRSSTGCNCEVAPRDGLAGWAWLARRR